MLGVLGGPGGSTNHSKCEGGGGKTPTFGNGLWGHRGRPDPQNDLCPILIKIQRFYGQPKYSHELLNMQSDRPRTDDPGQDAKNFSLGFGS